MSTPTDDIPNPAADAVAPEADTAAAKPARKRRAAKPAEATAEAPVESAAVTSEEPAAEVKPRRRRKPEAAGDAPAAEPSIEPAPVLAQAPAEPAPAVDVAPQAGDGDGEAEAAGGAPAEGGEAADGEGGRRRRRNRRRGRDRDGREGGDGAEGTETAPRVHTPEPAAGEVFAQVLSGAFDVEVEPEAVAEGADGGEAPAAHKRVLQAEPEAPKLHKVLAQAGIGSRREMEEMILEGRITVNGQPAHIGQRISFGDQIKVGGKPVRVRIVPPPPRLLAYHKPVGEVVTHDDPQNRPTVFRRLPRLQQGKWQSVGRLDINTEGLLLFTNSGELANQLMHPRFGVEREYAVRVLGTLNDETRGKLLEGVEVDGQKAAFKAIEDGGGEGANHWYRVVITEGRNREVRKLFDSVGMAVSRLIRIRYGTVVLPRGLKRGVWVDLGDEDLRAIRRLAGAGQQQPREAAPVQRADEPRGNNKQRNKQRGGRGPERPPGRGPEPRMAEAAPRRPAEADGNRAVREHEPDDNELDDIGPIPNPLEQTFDKRFVQNPRSSVGGRGFGRGGGGFGPGGSAPPRPKKGAPGAPREPDPMQTSVGYIGADAFHRKNRGGGGGRGGSGGGGFGGFGGGGGGGGGRRGR